MVIIELLNLEKREEPVVTPGGLVRLLGWVLTAAGDVAIGQGGIKVSSAWIGWTVRGCFGLCPADRELTVWGGSPLQSRAGRIPYVEPVVAPSGFLASVPALPPKASSSALQLCEGRRSVLPVICLPGTAPRGTREGTGTRAGGWQEPQESICEVKEAHFSDRQTEAQSGEATSPKAE